MLHPEIAQEVRPQVARVRFQSIRPRVLAAPAKQRRDQHAGLIGVALHLDQGERGNGIATVLAQDPRAGIAPALIDGLASLQPARHM